MSDSPIVPNSPSYPPYYVATYKGRTVAIKRDASYETTIKIIQRTIHKLRSTSPHDICLSTTLPEYGDTLVQISEEMWPDVVGLVKSVEVTLEEMSDAGDDIAEAGTGRVTEDLKKLDLDETISPTSAEAGKELKLEEPEPGPEETGDSRETLDGREYHAASTLDDPPIRKLKKLPPILTVNPEPRPPSVIDFSQQNNSKNTLPSPTTTSETDDALNLGTGARQHRAVPGLPLRRPPLRTPPPPTPPRLPPPPPIRSPPLPPPVSIVDESLNLGTGARPKIAPTRPQRRITPPLGGTTRPLMVEKKHDIAAKIVPGPTPPSNEARLSISIDFGTMFSGVAYGSSDIAGGRVQLLQQWPDGFGRKVPTCLRYTRGQVSSWSQSSAGSGFFARPLCDKFKLFLDPNFRPSGPGLPYLPPGKRPVDLVADFLTCLWNHVKQQVTIKIGTIATLDIWLTVPARWDAKACSIMREAAVRAGIVQQDSVTRAMESTPRDRLRIITGLEAAAVYCAQLTTLHQLHPDQHLMICDAGAQSVDVAIYKMLGSPTKLEIGETCSRTGADCGSRFLELRFRDAVAELLKGHPEFSNFGMSHLRDQFAGTHKLKFTGEADDGKRMLLLPRSLVFDPIIAEVLQLIEAQLVQFAGKVDALMLVGGFSHSEYLLKQVNNRFESRIGLIARPVDIDTAVCRGAARCGLMDYEPVPVVIAPRAYMIRGSQSVEPEDRQKRPQFIRQNKAGAEVCQNRLRYLVRKGASVRKGKSIVLKLRKLSKSLDDSVFAGTLYTSDSDYGMRYADEEGVLQMCIFKVDLSSLPHFGLSAKHRNQTEFDTPFEIGFEFHSAEVRGALLHDGKEWNPIVFEFPDSHPYLSPRF
ncbi:hypothetical protein FRC09_004916 [Ceratobasidium sp. 395]|nr:hypothetical protein FRC09_004916 [Ceratobasidium sp. 395]